MSKIKALLFDKDGTLFDFTKTWDGWAAGYLLQLASGDMDRAREIGFVVGFDMDRKAYLPDSIIIACSTGEIAEVLAREIPELTPAEIARDMDIAAGQIQPVEAVPLKPLMAGFQSRGMKLGVATNDTQHPTRANLDALGLWEAFDFVVTSDSGYTPKPAPDTLLAFAAHVGVAPEDCAMVGDSTHDLHAGRAAGMTTVGVLTGMAGADDLSPYADVVLPDIGHIPGWLDRG